jgi:uncharacterized protein
VKDPAEVVKAGQKIKVRVLSVDLQRKRIGLSAKSGVAPAPRPPKPTSTPGGGGGKKGGAKPAKPAPAGTFSNNPFAALKK